MNPQFLKSVVNGNEYVQACTSNKAKDVHSLSSLVDRSMSQSDCIKLGTGLEKVFSELIVVLNSQLTDIKPANSRGKKERDHLFVNEETKTIFYAELKSNLNLDTEKCKSTTAKCLQIKAELTEEYPEYTIKMFLVGLRYLNRSMFPSVISFKYEEIDDHMVGVNDYFEALNTYPRGNLFADETAYKEFLTHLADQMFK